VNRYSNTIAGLFFGHTHVDQFEVGYSDYSDKSYHNAIANAYIVPSLTPTSGMPAFRVYNVDPVTFAVLDSITYIADMTNPSFQTTGPVWTEYYSAKEVYGPLLTPPVTDPNAELCPAFWHNVTEVFANNPAAFMEYYARKSRGWNVGSCTGTCQTNEICQMQALRSENNCYKPSPGIHLSKRDLTPHGDGGHRDECGISVSREVLGMIAQKKELMTRLVERTTEKLKT
jgi:sphingomyelin phosphodiesterase